MKAKRFLGIVISAILVFSCMSMLSACDNSKEEDNKLVLKLKWLPQAQFMGYYVAQDKGYYTAEGLEVEIQTYGGTGDTPETSVDNGSADIAITWVSSLTTYQAQDYDLVNVAQIFQSAGMMMVAKKTSGLTTPEDITNETTVGSWYGGNEYPVYAMLAKYNKTNTPVQQNFDMNAFLAGDVKVASAMTYNELGLVVNSYTDNKTAGAGLGLDAITVFDTNALGVGMLEDCMVVSKEWLGKGNNKEKLVKFLKASIKGWQTACSDTDAAAAIVYTIGQSVCLEHQKYMASEVAKLVTKNTSGATVAPSAFGTFDTAALTRTLDITKQYATKNLDSAAKTKLAALKISDIYDSTYITQALAALNA